MTRFVFDLDGTLCSHDSDGDYHNAEPYEDRIAEVNRLAESTANTVIINTARGSETERDWTEVTHKQLMRWNVNFDRLICGVKPYADVYVDDSAQNDNEFFGGPPHNDKYLSSYE